MLSLCLEIGTQILNFKSYRHGLRVNLVSADFYGLLDYLIAKFQLCWCPAYL